MLACAGCTSVRAVASPGPAAASQPTRVAPSFQEPPPPAGFAVLSKPALAAIPPPALAGLGVEAVAGVSLPSPGNPFWPHHIYAARAQGSFLVFATDYGMSVPANLVKSEASNYGAWGTIQLSNGRLRTYPDPVPAGIGWVSGNSQLLVLREEVFEPPRGCPFVSEPDGCRGWTLRYGTLGSGPRTVLASSSLPQDFTIAPLPVVTGSTIAWTTVSPKAPNPYAPAVAHVRSLRQGKTWSFPVANGMGFDYLPGNGSLWVVSPTARGDSILQANLSTGLSRQWLAPRGEQDLTPGLRWVAFSRNSPRGVEVAVARPGTEGLGSVRTLVEVPAEYGMYWLTPSLLAISTGVGYTFVDVAASPVRSVSWNADFDYEAIGGLSRAGFVLCVRLPDGSEALLVLRALG